MSPRVPESERICCLVSQEQEPAMGHGSSGCVPEMRCESEWDMTQRADFRASQGEENIWEVLRVRGCDMVPIRGHTNQGCTSMSTRGTHFLPSKCCLPALGPPGWSSGQGVGGSGYIRPWCFS